MPVSAPDRRPLISYLRIQQDRDKRLLAILRDADARIGRELNRLRAQSGIGAGMRLEQLGRAQAAMRREMATMWQRIGDEVNAGKAAAAAAAVEATFPGTLLRSVLPARDVDYMLRSAKETAQRGIAAVEARQTLSYVPLSERVYHEANLTSGKIDEIINSALARGASAVELAKDVRAYINPNTPGGVRYAAMRLGRTELNNSFHAQAVQQGIKEPWTTTMKWNLSGSHPKPDECNEYAENESFPGGGAGIWKPEEVPAKPHPNCLCYVTPEVEPGDEFIRKFQAGEYDQYLEDEFGLPRAS